MPPWPPTGKGPQKYDLVAPWPSETPASLHEFGLGIVRCIASKGYCVVHLPLPEDDLQKTLQEVANVDASGQFSMPPAEVVDGLLGEEGSARIAEIATPADPESSESYLEQFDAHMSTAAAAILPLCPDELGFDLRTRTMGMLHETGKPQEAFPDVTQAEALKWFETFNKHRIMCLGFLGPECGTLELQPFDDEANYHEIETEPGMFIYLRADGLSHKFQAPEETYVVSCWLLEAYCNAPAQRTKRGFHMIPAAKTLKDVITSPLEDSLEEEIPRSAQRTLHHMHQKGGKTAVRSTACVLPTNLDFWSMWHALSNGIDCAEVIPYQRWEHDDLYDPDPAMIKFGKVPCKHACFVEGLELFDNKFFRISPLEANTIAPEQRKSLEIGYEVMYYAGFKKSTMEKTATGVYVGAEWNEWNVIRPMDSPAQGSYGATSNMTPITANRLSYLLGFNGPSMTLDTEGSSSLVAVCKGTDAVCVMKEKRTSDQSLCLGVSFLLAPTFLLVPARGGALSHTGRCLTFDETTDGYITGDGCGGVLLAPLGEVLETQAYDDDEHPVRGMLSAVRMGNIGRVSALGAPSGPGYQKLLSQVIKSGGFSPLDVDAVECHGAGGLLAEAVEVSSLGKVLKRNTDKQADPEVLNLGCMKTCVANMRAAAGVCGLIKLLATECWGVATPMIHFRILNPHVEVEGTSMFFCTESLLFRSNSAYCGVTAKGFGGTLAHVVAWGRMDNDLCPAADEVPATKRVDLAYWPGGGGELDDDACPDRAYTIQGSWSAWQETEDMEEEELGVFGYTVTLGEHCHEHFQIQLDGDPERVLHPRCARAPKDTPVLGPTNGANGFNWLLDGRAVYVPFFVNGDGDQETDFESATPMNRRGDPRYDPSNIEYVQLESSDQGKPGHQYRIRLCVSGKWRTVTWEKLTEEEPETHPTAIVKPPPLIVTGRYYVVASWNCWSFDQEMEPDPHTKGLFSTEVLLTRPGGEFQILVNRDLDQVLFPACDQAGGNMMQPVLGPEPPSESRGLHWFLGGHPGDVFRIEFQMDVDDEQMCVTKHVNFKRIRRQTLSEEQLVEAKQTSYYVVGTWDGWAPNEMRWNKANGCFQSDIKLNLRHAESFQILVDGDWRRVIHPSAEATDPYAVRGPDDWGHGLTWTIGDNEARTGRAAAQYTIKLYVTERVPTRVEWERHD